MSINLITVSDQLKHKDGTSYLMTLAGSYNNTKILVLNEHKDTDGYMSTLILRRIEMHDLDAIEAFADKIKDLVREYKRKELNEL